MQIKDINITANNGTTSVVYTAIQPQNGTEPAVWMKQDLSKPRSTWPRFTTRLRGTKGNASTIVSMFANMPVNVGSDEKPEIKYLTFTCEFAMSNQVAPAHFVEFENNVSKLMKEQVKQQVLKLEPAI